MLPHPPLGASSKPTPAPEYIEANQNWIDVLDMRTTGISGEEAEELAHIFETCAKYENSLWDALQGI